MWPMRRAIAPLPDDWWIGVTDVVGSTAAIAAGRYKSVNLAGGVGDQRPFMNALHGASFPFVFGGDGATLRGVARRPR